MMQQRHSISDLKQKILPLMIEAILHLLIHCPYITKVEDPEELDTRFSKFTPADNSDPLNSETLEKLQGAEEFLNLLNKVKEAAAATSAPVEEPRADGFVLDPVVFFFFTGRSNRSREINCSRLSRRKYII